MLHFLSREERYACDQECDESLRDAMAALVAFDGAVDTSEWRVIGRRDRMTVYRTATARTGPNNGGARVNVLATGLLRGTLAQIAEGLSAETDGELLATEALLSGAQVAVTAAAVLNVAERASARARFRFAGVKWCAWTRAPADSARRHGGEDAAEGAEDAPDGQEQLPQQTREQHELLTYERMGVMHDDDDREVAYHVVRSLDRPEWPLFVPRAPGLRRAELSLCFLFRAVCDDLVECLVAGSYPARASSAAQHAADATVAERVLTASRALRCYEAKKLSRLMDKARDRPVHMSKNCLRCGARRSVLDPLRNCGICKKSVCSACRQSKRVFQLHKHLLSPETEPFCSVCLARARLPSAAATASRPEHSPADRRKAASNEPASWRHERASLPSNLEYKNYDRLLQSYAQRRRPRAASAAPSRSSSLPTSSSAGSVGESSSSEEVAPGSKPTVMAPTPSVAAGMPSRQLLELRRERQSTLLCFPLARTVVQDDLYLLPDGESGGSTSNEAETVFRRHRERQEQLEEEFERPNLLHRRLMEEQERRLAGRAVRSEPTASYSEDDAATASATTTRRRAMTTPSHKPEVRRRKTPRSEWADAEAFRDDLYARF